MDQLAEFIGNHIILVGLFLVVFFLFLRSSYQQLGAGMKNVTIEQMTTLINQQNAKVIDVRSSESYKQGHIANAVNIPLEKMKAGTAKLDNFKTRNVVVYCQVGRSSMEACKLLSDAGVESVFNLQGGINQWLSEKLPLTK